MNDSAVNAFSGKGSAGSESGAGDSAVEGSGREGATNDSGARDSDDLGVPGFNEALQIQSIEPGLWSWTAHEGWRQGRTIFGGLTVAAVVKALQAELTAGLTEDAPAPTLRTVQYSFLAPVVPGVETQIEVSVDRRGKSATFVSAVLRQEDAVIGRAQAVFGVRRNSKVQKVTPPHALEKSFDDAITFPYIEGVTPVFTKQFEMKWGTDELPLQGEPEGIVGGYFRNKTEATGDLAIVAMLDVWPPSVITMVDRPVAASSVALTMHLVADIPEFGPEDWFEFRYTTESAGGGYATEVGQLVFDGQVIGWIEQLVAVFDG